MARSSISAICAGVTGSKWLKSNRSRSGADERALLLDVVAEHLRAAPSAGGGSPVWLRRIASRRVDVDRGSGLLARLDRALDDAGAVAVQPGQRVDGVEHLGPAGVGA